MEDNSNGGLISREKIDQLTTWFDAKVAAAFFSSPERFSCVNVTTAHFDDDDDLPLFFSSPSLVIDAPGGADVSTLPV